MRVSRQGIIEIASHEAIVDMPYRHSKGLWTIGIGHTASAGPPDPSQMPRGRRILLSEIFRIVAAARATFEKRVNKAVKVPVAQHEFDALTSFDFNTGGIDRATLVRHLSSGDRAKAATAFMNWSKPPVNGRLGTEAPSVKREWRAAALVARERDSEGMLGPANRTAEMGRIRRLKGSGTARTSLSRVACAEFGKANLRIFRDNCRGSLLG